MKLTEETMHRIIEWSAFCLVFMASYGILLAVLDAEVLYLIPLGVLSVVLAVASVVFLFQKDTSPVTPKRNDELTIPPLTSHFTISAMRLHRLHR